MDVPLHPAQDPLPPVLDLPAETGFQSGHAFLHGLCRNDQHRNEGLASGEAPPDLFHGGHLVTDYALHADFFKKKGDELQAKEKRNAAIGIFRECGADGWVKKHEEEPAKP